MSDPLVGASAGGIPSLFPQEPQYEAPSERNVSQSGQSSLCSSPQYGQYLSPLERASPHLSHVTISSQQAGNAFGALSLDDDEKALPVLRDIPYLLGDVRFALLGYLAVSLHIVDERIPFEGEILGGAG